jgi:hypothetical protein
VRRMLHSERSKPCKLPTPFQSHRRLKRSYYRPSCRLVTRLAEVASSKQVFICAGAVRPCSEKQEDQGDGCKSGSNFRRILTRRRSRQPSASCNTEDGTLSCIRAAGQVYGSVQCFRVASTSTAFHLFQERRNDFSLMTRLTRNCQKLR